MTPFFQSLIVGLVVLASLLWIEFRSYPLSLLTGFCL